MLGPYTYALIDVAIREIFRMPSLFGPGALQCAKAVYPYSIRDRSYAPRSRPPGTHPSRSLARKSACASRCAWRGHRAPGAVGRTARWWLAAGMSCRVARAAAWHRRVAAARPRAGAARAEAYRGRTATASAAAGRVGQLGHRSFRIRSAAGTADC